MDETDERLELPHLGDIPLAALKQWVDLQIEKGKTTVELDIDYYRGEIYDIHLEAN